MDVKDDVEVDAESDVGDDVEVDAEADEEADAEIGEEADVVAGVLADVEATKAHYLKYLLFWTFKVLIYLSFDRSIGRSIDWLID